MRRHLPNNKNYIEYRPMIAEVFKNLRKKGLLARMNFSCCCSCGSYELNDILKTNKNKIGYVFWHHQSEESFKINGRVYLYYGSNEDNDSIEVGKLIVEELNINNIPCCWNGSSHDAILVGGKKDNE